MSSTRSLTLSFAVSAALTGSAALIGPGIALGQNAAAQSAEADVPVEIVVTGTRTRSTFAAPTPTQAYSLESMEARGQTNVAQLLLEIPAFSGRSGNTTAGQRGERAGLNFADLRALGSMRTLVLVNGRRFVPTVPLNVGGYAYQVDINQIPSLMIERLDVVTGGASAQYGSDAIAGVTNLILRKRYDGIQGEIQSGISDSGDGNHYRVGMLGGFSFADGRGQVVLSGDFDRSERLGGPSNRDWSDIRTGLFVDPAATATNGLPRNVIDVNYQPGNRAPGGLIVNTTGLSAAARSALIGLQFDSPTAVSPFIRGKYNPATSITTFAALQSGGGFPHMDTLPTLPSLKRTVGWGHASYELTDSLSAFVDVSFAKSTGRIEAVPLNDQSSVYDNTTKTGSQTLIYADNAYIPAALRSFIPVPSGPATAVRPAESFTMSRINYDFGPRDSGTDTKGHTITGGLEGEFANEWSWDASYIFGSNDYERTVASQRDRLLYQLAADAVVNPANGQIVCRSTLTNPTNGCVPVNLFGQGTPSQQALNYFTFTAFGVSRYQQQAAQANLRGNPFATWAGDVSIATGVEARHETVKATIDSRTASLTPDEVWGLAYSGKFTVIEGYLEATAPLARDMAWARSVAVNGAVRHARYSGDASAAGGQTTWKAGLTWEPLDGLLFRAGHSLDIRAPSLYELLLPDLTNVAQISYLGASTSGVLVGSGGNPNLVPEKSHTTTAGFTFRPATLPGLGFSADYFKIDLKGAIASVGGQNIATFCENGTTSFCSAMTFNSSGTLLSIANRLINLASLRTDGVDLSANYAGTAGADTWTVRANATYTRQLATSTPTPSGVPTIVDLAGGVTANAVPDWKATLLASYTHGGLTVSPNVRYVSGGKLSTIFTETATATAPIGILPADNNISEYYIFGLSATLDLLDNERFQVFGVVDNLFDRDPKIIPSAGVTQTNGGLYDFMGRYYRLGVRAKF
jgi:iron complex outermembrane receptor protein